MKLDRLITFFATNPSAKLLRAQYAPYIVHFLYLHFKDAGNLATSHTVLQQQLSNYLELLHETEPDVLRERADTYLNGWSTGETRWLRRFFDAEHAESVYQLTPHSEDALKFLTDVLDRTLGFIGTESRLTRIIATLSDIIVRGSADPDRRLAFLRSERARIDQEIQSIEAGNAVATHSPTAIRERFADAVSDLISLQADFRAVEESFKSITRDVQRRQAESIDSRGHILGFALDAEDQLKEQDQGTSFEAFVRLILSQSQQDELERMITELDEIHELMEQLDGKQRMKGMIGSLAAEAEKVLRTTRRLSSTLRRLLDSRASASRVRLAELLREIRALGARRAEDPSDCGIDVFTELELLNVHQRSFWEPPMHFQSVQLSTDQPSEDERVLAFRNLAAMQRLDWEAMRSNIGRCLQRDERVPLLDLLQVHPPTAGAIELLGYIQLAYDEGHHVDPEHVDIVDLDDFQGSREIRSYKIPRVVFLSERLRLLSNHQTLGRSSR